MSLYREFGINPLDLGNYPMNDVFDLLKRRKQYKSYLNTKNPSSVSSKSNRRRVDPRNATWLL